MSDPANEQTHDDQPDSPGPAAVQADTAPPHGGGAGVPAPWSAIDALRIVVALAGLAVAGFLLLESLATTALPGCGSGSACDAVLGSRWSRWLGIPVALPAAVLWLVALLAAITRQRSVLILAGLVLGGAAAWFVFVQVAFLEAICPYCITSHGLAVAMLFLAMVGVAHVPFKQLVVAVVALMMLIGGQVAFPSHVVEHRVLKHGGIEVTVSNYPILGDPRADHVVLLIYDYTCPHCRRLHGYLLEAIERYDGQLAVALAPAPLDADCNPYLDHTDPMHERGCELAGAMIAVWLADASRVASMDRYLAEAGAAEGWSAYRERAASLVGAEAFERALADERVGAFLRAGCELNAAVGRSAGVGDTLPKLVLGTAGRDLIVGRPGAAQGLFDELEAMLGLRPVESGPQ